jgi:hypothetical protein
MFDLLIEFMKFILPKLNRGVCRELRGLFDSVEDLLQRARAFYKLFDRLAESPEKLKADPGAKQQLRNELKALLQALVRYEVRLKDVAVKLSLLDEGGLSLKLYDVPGSSADIFETHFVKALAPQYVANKDGTEYVLRRTERRTGESLVTIDELGHISLDMTRLFKEGRLTHETVDLSNRGDVDSFLVGLDKGIKDLESVQASLRALILKHCKVEDLF